MVGSTRRRTAEAYDVRIPKLRDMLYTFTYALFNDVSVALKTQRRIVIVLSWKGCEMRHSGPSKEHHPCVHLDDGQSEIQNTSARTVSIQAQIRTEHLLSTSYRRCSLSEFARNLNYRQKQREQTRHQHEYQRAGWSQLIS
jgi:hypothetical protein